MFLRLKTVVVISVAVGGMATGVAGASPPHGSGLVQSVTAAAAEEAQLHATIDGLQGTERQLQGVLAAALHPQTSPVSALLSPPAAPATPGAPVTPGAPAAAEPAPSGGAPSGAAPVAPSPGPTSDTGGHDDGTQSHSPTTSEQDAPTTSTEPPTTVSPSTTSTTTSTRPPATTTTTTTPSQGDAND